MVVFNCELPSKMFCLISIQQIYLFIFISKFCSVNIFFVQSLALVSAKDTHHNQHSLHYDRRVDFQIKEEAEKTVQSYFYMNLLNNENNVFTFLITCHFFAKLYYFTKVRKKTIKILSKIFEKCRKRIIFSRKFCENLVQIEIIYCSIN